MVTFILPESPFNNVLPRLEMTHRQPIPAIINPDCFPTWPHYCFPLPCLVDLQIKLIAFHDVSQGTLLEINSISHASQMLRYAEFLQPSKPVSVQILIKWLLFQYTKTSSPSQPLPAYLICIFLDFFLSCLGITKQESYILFK